MLEDYEVNDPVLRQLIAQSREPQCPVLAAIGFLFPVFEALPRPQLVFETREIPDEYLVR